MFAMNHILMRTINSVSVLDSLRSAPRKFGSKTLLPIGSSALDSLKSAPPSFGRRMLLPIERPILAAPLNSASSAMLNNVSAVHMSAPIAPFLIDSSLIQLLHSRNSVTAVAPCSTRTAQLLLDSIYVIT